MMRQVKLDGLLTVEKVVERLKFADTYYGELNHYGMYWLRWADVRRQRRGVGLYSTNTL